MSLDQFYLLPPAQQQAILSGPALSPPVGIIPNFENPPNRNALGLVIVTFLFTMATLAFILATYVKVFCIRQRNVEDYLALLAYALYTAGIVNVYSVISGVGLFVHQWDVRVKDLAGILYAVHIGSELYAVTMILIKAAILLQWVRIFVPRGTRGAFFWICHVLVWINLSFYTAILIWGNTSCKPYAKLWDKTLHGTCSTNSVYDIVTASYNVASDVFIFLLPQRVIWKLHLSYKKRVGIAIIFAVGLSGCIAAAYRLYASIHYSQASDVTYGVGGLGVGIAAEQTCAILVYCVPNIPKFFKEKRYLLSSFKSLFSRSTHISSTPSYTFNQMPGRSDKLPSQDSYPDASRVDPYSFAGPERDMEINHLAILPGQAVVITANPTIWQSMAVAGARNDNTFDYQSSLHANQLASSSVFYPVP
ncbi:hypothetical protein F5Y18DRAFT_442860 [Xylariaceae sp. FL1019]|nr:hypothetical protein F5Y18DRAFT_442860 [Xylariaceae sp. FL1019]